MNKKIFIGVAWPYTNGPAHIGNIAGNFLPADIYSRFKRITGNEVLMVSGGDVHGTPTLIKAEKEEILPDSTEDVTVSLKQEDAEHELNTIAKSIDTKQETNPMNSSLNNEEKTGNTDLYRQLYFNSS